MEEIISRHRKEQRDLQSQITQKKKSASKKTRKAVNDECAKLEQELRERQDQELNAIQAFANGHAEESNDAGDAENLSEAALLDSNTAGTSVAEEIESLSMSDPIGNAAAKDSTFETENSSNLSQQPHKKQNRQKARLARRAAEQEAAAEAAAEEASHMPDLKQRERERMIENFTQRGLQEKEIAANGHCLYSAIADQVKQLGLELEPSRSPQSEAQSEVSNPDYKVVRAVTAQYISEHSDDFVPFLEEPLDQYLRKIRDTGEWGGQLELMALARVYNITINVLQSEGRAEKIEGSDAVNVRKEAWLAYYRHGFGLGEHYNSLRKGPSAAVVGE